MTPIDKISTAVQIHFDKLSAQTQISDLLFPNMDIQDAFDVKVSEFGGNVPTARTIAGSDATNVTTIDHGAQTVLTPALIGEKIKIDAMKISAEISDNETATVAEATFYRNANRTLMQQLISAMNKSAIDLILDGTYSQTTKAGAATVVIDYDRAAGNSITYDLTLPDTTVEKAILLAVSAVSSHGANQDMLGVLLGADWLNALQSSEEFKEKAKHSDFVIPMDVPLFPGYMGGRPEGVAVVGRYRVDGFAFPLTLLAYTPRYPFLRTVGGTSIPYVPTNTLGVFEMGSGVSAYRNVEYIVGDLKRMRAAPIVVDSFAENDPVGEYLRAQSRPLCIMPDINRTAKVVGTFA